MYATRINQIMRELKRVETNPIVDLYLVLNVKSKAKAERVMKYINSPH